MTGYAPGPDRAYRVLLVNPNASSRTTEMMRHLLEEHLDAPAVAVTARTAGQGPELISTPEALEASADHVIEQVLGELRAGNRPDAVIVAAFGDPGVASLRRRPDMEGIAVNGIGEAALRESAVQGQRFAVATTTADLSDAVDALVREVGVADTYAGIELTDTAASDLASSYRNSRTELAEAVDRALLRGVDRVVIGGGPLSAVANDLASRYPGVIIEPIAAAARWVRRQVLLRDQPAGT